HARVTRVVSVGGRLAADRAGAWHRSRSPSGEVNSNVTVARIVRQFDGAALLRALEAATARLEAGADEVNALNVYPVPDGDTGTNMLHTMRAATKHARDAEPAIDKVSAAAAYGALMGARGNSGVILSQVIRGLKEAFAGKQTAGVADVRRAAELVDAGARGLQLILEGVLSSFTGTEIPLERMAPAERPAGHSSVSEAPSWEGAYDVQFLVERPSRPVAAVREEMLKFGADC